VLFASKEDLRSAVKDAVTDALKDKNGDALKAADLKKEIARLEVERDKKQEEFDRREREVEHKVGLERKRQEFEIEQSKREAASVIKEENLKADKERFKAEMDFQRERLEGEVKALRSLVEHLLERVPSAQILAEIGHKK